MNKLPITPNKSSIIHDLILKNLNIETVEPFIATKRDLLTFHTKDYLNELQENEDFLELEEYCLRVVGSSLTAIKYLNEPNIVFHFDGGRHHAKPDEFSGFCYVNDIVIAIQAMPFKKIFYLDLDIHFGDAVSDAFYFTDSVLCMSLHLLEEGFFPNRGGVDDIGEGKGKYYNINVPLKSGLQSLEIVMELVPLVIERYCPECIVLVCGGDVLAGDPIGKWNIDENNLDIYKFLFRLNLPILVLGGGGYDMAATAKYYCLIAQCSMDHSDTMSTLESEYFEYFKSNPEFNIRKLIGIIDENDTKYLENIKNTILERVENIF